MALDRYLDVRADPSRQDHLQAEPQCRSFRELAGGGLVSLLLERTTAKDSRSALAQRAMNYVSMSALHLHLDAIEVAALTEGNEDVGWEDVKAMAAHRVLELAHMRWSPRHGSVFAELTSDLEVKLRQTDEAGRTCIRQAYRQLTPDLFDRDRRLAPHPSWREIGVMDDVAPIHAHKLLLAIAADRTFLVDDRLEAWAMDMVSAALAMHGLAWSDRYATHGLSVSPELIFWRAFDSLLFSDDPREDVEYVFLPALTLNAMPTDAFVIDNLMRCRASYREAMAKLGVDWRAIGFLAGRARREKGLVYRG